MLEGILRVLGITVTMAAAFAAVIWWSQLGEHARAIGQQLHLVRKPAPLPVGRPIEAIAADVGRLRVLLRHIPPETPEARREGWRRAYDDVLAEGCLALGVENLLESTPAGPERDAERLRVEYLLGKAGLGTLDDVA